LADSVFEKLVTPRSARMLTLKFAAAEAALLWGETLPQSGLDECVTRTGAQNRARDHQFFVRADDANRDAAGIFGNYRRSLRVA
jgi:hypothetical protein